VSSHDVLVDKDPGATEEGRVFTVEVASFKDRSGARSFVQNLEDETDFECRIVRQPITGRFTVRVGRWTTERGTSGTLQSLVGMGYEGARVVNESSTSRRPRRLILRPAGAETLTTSELSLAVFPSAPGAWVEVDGSAYRGYLEIFVNVSNRLTIVNVVNLEDYLKGVVPAELSPAVFPQVEAVKAQAVAARTYAIRHMGQYAGEGFDICSTPACQVYGGFSAEQRMSSDAVVETRGRILTYKGEPIDALYTSTCGGHTEDVQNVFPGSAQPYLVSRKCYRDGIPIRLRTTSMARMSLEVVGAAALGIIEEQEISHGFLEESADLDDVARWAGRALGQLGMKLCREPAAGDEPASKAALARWVVDALCWEGRLPFLVSDPDVERLVPRKETTGLDDRERRSLAYWIRRQWLRPSSQGLEPERPLTRGDVLGVIYRFASSLAETPLIEASLAGVENQTLIVRVQDSLEKIPLAPNRSLFRRVGDSTYPVAELALQVGDSLSFHHREDGIDWLILNSSGTGFDKTSRLFRWVVRKTNDELSRTIGSRREGIGRILDLRPKQYGKSGRVVELEIAGEESSIVLRGLDVRRWLGLRENLFYIDRQHAPGGEITAWVFTGGGWGHGVGLCQVGAFGMASAGYTYEEILQHYYPGTELVLEESWNKGK
jgi:stage II sporulation protein D